MTDETGIRYHNGRYWNEKESDQPPDRYWDGELKNGIPHGTGTYYVPNGAKYVGTYKNGKRHGRGTSTYPFGRIRKWIGEWKDGEIFGNGKMFLEYGRIFEGQVFGNGGQYGKGIETLKDGKKICWCMV